MPTEHEEAERTRWRRAIEEHSRLEHGEDLDAALASMSPDGIYEFYPYRLRISGESIKEVWKRLFSTPVLGLESGRKMESYVSYFNDVGVTDIVEISFLNEHGERETTTLVGGMQVDEEGKIMVESVHLDVVAMRYIDEKFDEEFRSLPGVVSF
jgi:hypothetical protein